ILTSRVTASASEIVAGAMKDYRRAVIVGDDHTFGKGTVQSFVHQPGRLGAIKVTTALFFRPGGTSTQHAGVAADIVLPSLLATDELGERYAPYSLEGQMIPPFLGPAFQRMSTEDRAWTPVTDGLLLELASRSSERVARSEAFSRIEEQLAEIAEEDDVLRLAELIEKRKEREAGSASSAAETGDADPAPADTAEDAAGDAGDAGSGGSPMKPSSEEEEAPQASDSPPGTGSDPEEEEEEPSPQQEEALRVLADLVHLQETAQSPWYAPQSASRSAPSSSQP
ncbi:MAG TPA: carboxy terminal-processing peptidase, partial [Myxococcota bacterium]|nr:carboxy terminal-processing peptidase [Myxococcota bacterium]